METNQRKTPPKEVSNFQILRERFQNILQSLGLAVANGWVPLWRLLSLAGICVVIYLVSFATKEIVSSNRWHSISQVTGDAISVYIEYPELVGRGSVRTFRVGIQNQGNQVLENVRVLFSSNGNIWFNEKNYAEFNLIEKSVATSETLTFTVSATLPDPISLIKEDVQIEYSIAENGNHLTRLTTFSSSPVMNISRFMESFESMQKIFSGAPLILGGLVTAGSSALAGLALLRGRSLELIKAIFDIFKE